MSDWKEYKLDELVEITSSKRIMRSEYQEDGIPFFRSKEIIELNSGNEITTELFISKERFLEIKKKFGTPSYGDILLTSVGTLGVPYFVNYKEEFYFKDGNLTWFRKFNNILRSKYLYYWFSSPVGRKALKEITIGSTQPALTITGLKSLTIHLPTLEEQDYIIEILDHLSSKIQLNTQINQTLEQIAQALFKSWFVDFDPVRAKVQALSDGLSFEQAELAAMQAISGKTPEELTALSQTQPDRYAELAETAKAFPCEMVKVDRIEVPKGWELSTIGDCYDVVMGQSPKGETYNENKQGMLFYQGRAEFGWRFPTPRLFTTDPKRIAEQNSILMSVRAPVGDINIALEKCCIGRGLAALQHKSKNLSFGLYQIQSIKPELDLFNGEGTVFGSINQANLKNIQIINPDEKFIQLFEKYLSSCDSKIMNNEIENNALKEIRDLLLPRLLSGEIQL
ncbi:restriction endonuclease subunit S [Haemophilus influenzae]|uniref:restriction endonuclease subunit S n=1 Tax=Haemophilus influenzae TaxID=727 RepID=UPI000DD4765D|nr:restriction endonuclease subunit S [Haemophilus influenzae]